MISEYIDHEGNTVKAIQYTFNNWEETAKFIGFPPYFSGKTIADGSSIHIEMGKGRQINLARGDYIIKDADGNVFNTSPLVFDNMYAAKEPMDREVE
jgi:hypothetical protein